MIKKIKQIYDYYSTKWFFLNGGKRKLTFKINDAQASPWFVERKITERLKDIQDCYDLTLRHSYKMALEDDDWVNDLLTIEVTYSRK